MTLEATSSISWVNTVLDAAVQRGASRAQVLALAGIAASELQRQRWPIDHIARLWRAAAQATQDPSFGLTVGASVGPASLNVVSYLLQSAPTLRAALAAVQKYQSLISDGGRFQTIAGEGHCWVIYHPRQGTLAFSPHQVEAVLAAVVVLARGITGRGNALVPLAVQFNQPQLGPLAAYTALLGNRVQFEQAFSGVLWDDATLDAPLPQADQQLAQLHQRLANERLAALTEGNDLVPRLAQWLAQQLTQSAAHGTPTRRQAALHLGLSERTLARQLQVQQHSFSSLLDAARRSAALQALQEGQPSAPQLASALGFADASVLQRAFKRWTGQTPGQWRSQFQKLGSDSN